MGRKIPGKKHRGVKDPLKQQAKRLAELESKINAPPKDVEQAVPKSLERVIRLKEAVKSGQISKRTRRRRGKNRLICIGGSESKPLRANIKPDKAVPLFQQKPGESGHAFYHRVCRLTHNFLGEAAFERKYNVSLQRNPDTGKVQGLSNCPRDEVDELAKLKAKHKNIKRRKKLLEPDGTPKLSKAEKRRKKLEMKRSKKLNDSTDEFESFKDVIKFGEVVHAPPQLKARPKNADQGDISKPGKRSLLLNALFTKNDAAKSAAAKPAPVDRSGKRKNLPAGERRRLEEEQRDVIAAYRSLKAEQSRIA